MNARAKKVEFNKDCFIVSLFDGRVLSVPKTWFPSLCGASDEQLNNYILS